MSKEPKTNKGAAPGIDPAATLEAQSLADKLDAAAAPQDQVPAVAAPTALERRRAELKEWGVGDDGVIPGVGHQSREDVIVPRIQLVQASSDVAQDADNPIPMGNVIRSDTKEKIRDAADTGPIYVIPLMKGKKRQYFRDRKLFYQSHDTVNHAVDSPGGEREDGVTKCAVCPDAQWTDDPENPKKQKPPKCGEVFTYPVIVLNKDGEVEDMTPMLLDLKSLSVPAAKALNSTVEWSGRPLYSFVFALTTGREQRPKGPSFKWIARLHDRIKSPDDPRAQAAMAVFHRLENANVVVDGEDGEGEDF